MKHWFKAILLIWLIIPISCVVDDDGELGCNLTDKEVPITAINLITGSINEKQRFTTLKSLNVEEAALEFSIDNFAYNSKIESKQQFNFINKSFATPACGTYISANYLTNLSIKSDGRIYSNDSIYDSGIELNNLFQVFFNKENSISIADFIEMHDTSRSGNNKRFGRPGSSFIFQCNEKVDSLTNQTLSFFFTLDDSRIIEVSTTTFEIK